MRKGDYSEYLECAFQFVRYYRYTFYFSSTVSGKAINVHIGGSGYLPVRINIEPKMTLGEILNEAELDSVQIFISELANGK